MKIAWSASCQNEEAYKRNIVNAFNVIKKDKEGGC